MMAVVLAMHCPNNYFTVRFVGKTLVIPTPFIHGGMTGAVDFIVLRR
jgi:hypothetical protein